MLTQPDLPGKRLRGIESICNGCRSCEVWCSFFLTNSFQPTAALIAISKDEKNGIDRPITDCLGLRCAVGGKEALCVDYCPTGALVFGDEAEYQKRLDELWEAQQRNPEYKMIAPWVRR